MKIKDLFRKASLRWAAFDGRGSEASPKMEMEEPVIESPFPAYPSAIFVDRFGLTYFPVPRAANTSIKVAIAGALGYGLEELARSRWPHPTRAQGVHSNEIVRWNLRPLNPSNSFAFTVVRHPVTRLLSAWSLLVAEEDPHLWAVGMEPPTELLVLPEDLRSRQAVIEKFTMFISSAYFLNLLDEDVHFRPQITMFPSESVNLYKIEDGLGQLTETLRHITDQPFLSLNSGVNLTFLPLKSTDIPEKTLTRIQEIYSQDMVQLNYSDLEVTPRASAGKPLFCSETEFAFFEGIRERNRRILALWEELSFFDSETEQ